MRPTECFATPGFQDEATRHGFNFIQVISLLGERGQNPSWVIGKPGLAKARPDDQGRTLMIPAPFRFYAIRDDHEMGEYAGRSTITLLLPDEY